MEPLTFIFADQPVQVVFRLNPFATGDIYHVVVRSAALAVAVGKDHFFKVCSQPDGKIELEYSVTSPDHPKNKFRQQLAELLLGQHRETNP